MPDGDACGPRISIRSEATFAFRRATIPCLVWQSLAPSGRPRSWCSGCGRHDLIRSRLARRSRVCGWSPSAGRFGWLGPDPDRLAGRYLLTSPGGVFRCTRSGAFATGRRPRFHLLVEPSRCVSSVVSGPAGPVRSRVDDLLALGVGADPAPARCTGRVGRPTWAYRVFPRTRWRGLRRSPFVRRCTPVAAVLRRSRRMRSGGVFRRTPPTVRSARAYAPAVSDRLLADAVR